MKKVIVVIFAITIELLLCMGGASNQLCAQVHQSTQTLRLMSPTGLGYEIIDSAGLYTENFIIYDSLLNCYRKKTIKLYRINMEEVVYEFVINQIKVDELALSPIVIRRFWNGDIKPYKEKKTRKRVIGAHDVSFELTCIGKEPDKQEHYVFSLMTAPTGLPIEVCQYLWQCLSMCIMDVNRE